MPAEQQHLVEADSTAEQAEGAEEKGDSAAKIAATKSSETVISGQEVLQPSTADKATEEDGEQPRLPQILGHSALSSCEESQEYDYTAQSMLQAPLEKPVPWHKRRFRQKRIFRGPQKSRQSQHRPKEAGEHPQSDNPCSDHSLNNKAMAFQDRGAERHRHFPGVLLLAAALLSFLLSYGLTSLFHLLSSGVGGSGFFARTAFLRHFLVQSRQNVLLLLLLLALISSCIMGLLLLLLPLLRKSRRVLRQKQQSSQAQSTASVPGEVPHGEVPHGEVPHVVWQAASRQSGEAKLPEEQKSGEIDKKVMPSGGLTGTQSGAKHSGAPKVPRQSFTRRIKVTQQYEQQSGPFYFSLKFLLHKKSVYVLQSLLTGLFDLVCILFALGFPGQLTRPLVLLFALGFLLIGTLYLIILHNQYIQGMENLFQSTLQQIYQHSSPTNSYNQLNAANMLYAFAFVEARYFQSRVITEFQNILKLTRSSWYQTQYSNSPAILVEEVLRKLLSAVDFQQLLLNGPHSQSSGTVPGQLPIFSSQERRLREWTYYCLFLKNFQSLRAFRDRATVSLLSQMRSGGRSNLRSEGARSKSGSQGQRMPHFVLENYYFVGINLSQLRIKEAHFQNCQLSHSTWAHSELSDCSISSCRLDQIILYRSRWRRFLWTGNTAREIDVEQSSFLQGNIKYCNLQGTQSQSGSNWRVQHCLLQECDLNHSVFCLDSWQSVQASSCSWGSTLLSIDGELYHWEAEELAAVLGKCLQIKA